MSPHVDAIPRTESAVRNLAKMQDHLAHCCDHADGSPRDANVVHPSPVYMQRAIELSRIAGLEKRTGGCFGAVVVDKHGAIVGESYNHVIAENDPTWHGEVGAIRAAAKNLCNPHLRGCVLYTSSEPCPMCMGACYWARIDKVYYATTTADVKEHGHFEDEDFYLELNKAPADRLIPCTEYMRSEAVEVWKEFGALPDKCHY